MGTIIKGIYAVIPDIRVTNDEVENRVSQSFPNIPRGILHEMTGVETRYFVEQEQYPSDMAILSGEKCMSESSVSKDQIDLLIFASASQDITEPATANIIQKGMGLHCPVFDIKNACNSFLNAMDIADSMIQSTKYKNILIVSGETPSNTVNFGVRDRGEFKKHFAGYTLGDAGAAMILSSGEEQAGIKRTYFYSDGSTWDLATVMGGGSRYPRDIEKTYFTGDSSKIRDVFMSIGAEEFNTGLKKLSWKKDDIQKIFVHQVAMSNVDYMTEILGMDRSKFQIILPEYGNIASCCIPMSFFQYKKNAGSFNKGDKFVFIGFASGFSYGLIFYEV